MRGKAPAAVARHAQAAGVPVIAVCGQVKVSPSAWREAGFTVVFSTQPVPAGAAARGMTGAPALIGRAEAARALRRASAEAVRFVLP